MEVSQKVFYDIKELQDRNIYLLKHVINLSKGAALKTVFNEILVNFPDY